jgi:hypothetical protein
MSRDNFGRDNFGPHLRVYKIRELRGQAGKENMWRFIWIKNFLYCTLFYPPNL